LLDVSVMSDEAAVLPMAIAPSEAP
jgi:hypothetical protein